MTERVREIERAWKGLKPKKKKKWGHSGTEKE